MLSIVWVTGHAESLCCPSLCHVQRVCPEPTRPLPSPQLILASDEGCPFAAKQKLTSSPSLWFSTKPGKGRGHTSRNPQVSTFPIICLPLYSSPLSGSHKKDVWVSCRPVGNARHTKDTQTPPKYFSRRQVSVNVSKAILHNYVPKTYPYA